MKKNRPSRLPQRVSKTLFFLEGRGYFTFCKDLGRDINQELWFQIDFADVDKLATMLRASVARMTNKPFPVNNVMKTMISLHHQGSKQSAKAQALMLKMQEENQKDMMSQISEIKKKHKIPTPVDHTAPIHYLRFSTGKTACGRAATGNGRSTIYARRVTCRACIDEGYNF